MHSSADVPDASEVLGVESMDGSRGRMDSGDSCSDIYIKNPSGRGNEQRIVAFTPL